MKFLKQACLKKVVFQRTLESLMMASPNDLHVHNFPMFDHLPYAGTENVFFCSTKKTISRKT